MLSNTEKTKASVMANRYAVITEDEILPKLHDILSALSSIAFG